MFYGWTVEYCLAMPAMRFFAMLRAARFLDAFKRMDDCDIAAIPLADSKYYKEIRGRFSGRAGVIEKEIWKSAKGPGPGRHRVVLDSGSVEAKDFMFALFRAKKGLA